MKEAVAQWRPKDAFTPDAQKKADDEFLIPADYKVGDRLGDKQGEVVVIKKFEDGTRILVPLTFAASQAYGTKYWCTATGSDAFSNHTKTGPLFIVCTADGARFQAHYGSQQFMDAEDAAVGLAGFPKEAAGFLAHNPENHKKLAGLIVGKIEQQLKDPNLKPWVIEWLLPALQSAAKLEAGSGQSTNTKVQQLIDDHKLEEKFLAREKLKADFLRDSEQAIGEIAKAFSNKQATKPHIENLRQILISPKIDDRILLAKNKKEHGLANFAVWADPKTFKIVLGMMKTHRPAIYRDFLGQSFSLAAADGHTEIVRAILGAAGDDKKLLSTMLTEKNNDGATALMLAARNGHTETMLTILDAAGSDELRRTMLTQQNEYGTTALIWAARKGRTKTVQAILNAAGDDKELLHKMLTQQDKYGTTALIYAAWYGHTETVQAILGAAGDDKELRRTMLTEKNNDGATVLMDAAGFGRTETVLAILKAAGDDKELLTEMLDAVNRDGKNAEELASKAEIRKALAAARVSLQQPVAAGRPAAGNSPTRPALG